MRLEITNMGFLRGSLSPFFLAILALGCTSVEANGLDDHTLARIIGFFDQNYKKVEESGAVRQYAVAINVPAEQCQENFSPDHNNFLNSEDPAENVKNKIYDEKVAFHQGKELIASGTLNKGKHKRHSEAILMNPPETSPMANLLNKRKNGCVVFYTYNSPCVQTCIDINGPYNILRMLENWSTREGLKAFVFKDIWKFDTEKDLKEKFRAITNTGIPLYRCVSSQTCYKCVEGDNFNENCIQ